MNQDEKQTSRRRLHRLRVSVFPEEKYAIERQAKQAGLSVARYLRDVGQGYPIRSIVDYEQVCILVRINSDLGRLGGLLKLWLTDDVRTALVVEQELEPVPTGHVVGVAIPLGRDDVIQITDRVMKIHEISSGDLRWQALVELAAEEVEVGSTVLNAAHGHALVDASEGLDVVDHAGDERVRIVARARAVAK